LTGLPFSLQSSYLSSPSFLEFRPAVHPAFPSPFTVIHACPHSLSFFILAESIPIARPFHGLARAEPLGRTLLRGIAEKLFRIAASLVNPRPDFPAQSVSSFNHFTSINRSLSIHLLQSRDLMPFVLLYISAILVQHS
jgi:hypothetical protein